MKKYLYLFFVVTILDGCSAFKKQRGDVIGRWQIKGHGVQGEIELLSDGNITGKSVPISAMCDRDSAEKPQILAVTSNVVGGWTLDDSIGELRLSMYDPANNQGCLNLFEDGFTKKSGSICNSQNLPNVCYELSKL